tara:strand:- start:266 stop:514 length:249 start_codon:yes stop_codon:yes gene_type:complete
MKSGSCGVLSAIRDLPIRVRVGALSKDRDDHCIYANATFGAVGKIYVKQSVVCIDPAQVVARKSRLGFEDGIWEELRDVMTR